MDKYLVAFLLTVFTAAGVFGQNTVNKPAIINRIEYVIDGNTSESALRSLSELKTGQEYDTESELNRAVNREVQDLKNRRVFESVDSSIEMVLETESEKHYKIQIKLVDAFSVTPVPYPSYDSNTGLRLGLKLYWNNFLGTMTDAYLGTGMDLRTNDSTGKAEIGEWNISPQISRIRIADDLFLSAGLSQSFNEEDYIDEVVPADSFNYSYHQSSFSVGTSIKIIDNFWYAVNLGGQFRYGYSGNLGPNFKQPWAFTPGQNVSYGQVDWTENFRDGYKIILSNNYRMGSNPDFFLVTSIDLRSRYYLPFLKRFNFTAQVRAFYQWGEIRSNVGSYLRGVQDNLMSGYTGGFVNLSTAFLFWRFEEVWDAQVHPFFDMGVVYNNESFDKSRDFNYSFGADFVLYLDALPSLVAVGSIGIDPKRFNKNNIFDSLEITISSSLFY